MRIELKVITRAKKEEIRKFSDGNYRIKLLVAPTKGKANKRIIQILSEEFGIKKGSIRIVSGQTTNRKIVEINEN